MGDNPIVELVRRKVGDTSKPFTIMAEFKAPPGMSDEVVEALAKADFVNLSRQEPGCLYFDVCRDADLPERFIVLESWTDETALAAHVLTPHFAQASMSVAAMLRSAPTVRVYSSPTT